MGRADENGGNGAQAGSELDARKAAILEAVVSAYIGTAQPVGSQLIAQAPGVNVSSATVRSEMVALEHEGFLAQPHTSAGRVPTDKGYRFFVDHLAEPGILGPVQRQRVHEFFDHVHGEMEEMLERTSGLLSELTSCAAVVVGPSHVAATVRSIQLVGLGHGVVLLVAVLSDGAVEKRSLQLDEDVTDEHLARASIHLHAGAQGLALHEVPAFASVGDPMVDRVVVAAAAGLLDLVAGEERDQVFVRGPSQVAAAFDAVETVRNVLAILEQQLVVVTLLRDVLGRGLSVAIGTEHGYEPLSSCAVVVAPVSVDGRDAGAIGLLGPTRMDYPRALAAAHMVGERLGEAIGYVDSGARQVGSAGDGSGGGRSARTRARGGRRGGT
jgi:heat-inducible transcriptional repressor